MQIVCNYVFLQGTYSVAHQRFPIRWTTFAGHPVEKEAVFHKNTNQRKYLSFAASMSSNFFYLPCIEFRGTN